MLLPANIAIRELLTSLSCLIKSICKLYDLMHYDSWNIYENKCCVAMWIHSASVLVNEAK